MPGTAKEGLAYKLQKLSFDYLINKKGERFNLSPFFKFYIEIQAQLYLKYQLKLDMQGVYYDVICCGSI